MFIPELVCGIIIIGAVGTLVIIVSAAAIHQKKKGK